MIHTFALSTHHTATDHSDDSGVVGFIESSLKKLWNGVLYGAGHHIGYELAWPILIVAIAAGLWLFVKKRRKNQAAAQEHHAPTNNRAETDSAAWENPPSQR
ncbi:hypothetical protein B5P44_01240 [Mycobacterium sp. CBMA 213]|uniref:Uncharacterized protein n=1 Tax=Mycolicibacterium sp. CBMA 213 TaxID=1968788 RepID=A0A343VRP3_9MYCO|nr:MULTISPECIES: hypothetical protein [unclassified Mycolicibacterium]AVN58567.1 hypothetical protein B5P44_p00272 [Mycolicibacterium sp. CBMA 213]MUL61208.1 hypothetical protein [Mycolicibacterium sp. CBMA 335]MUM03445.1 hypothetical protein [Mycolicibacterium sp. CBMA 213]